MIRAFLLACAAWAIVSASFAQGQSQSSFVWQSRNLNLKDLSLEFGQLYGTLLDASKDGLGVETYAYQGDTTRSLESILRDERLVAGKYLPKEADLFVCQLNPSICKILVKGDERNAKWTNGPADTIRLPKLSFEPVIVHREYPKKAQQRLDSIVVDERGGCEKYDGTCRKYIGNLNRVPMQELEGRYEGPVLVPTLAYRARITLTNISGPSRTPSAAPGTAPAAAAAPPAPPPQASASTVQRVLQKRPTVNRSIVPEVQIKMQQNGTEQPGEGTRQKVLELISHPFARNAGIPSGRVLVGVFDTWLDPGHCDLTGAVASYVDAGDRPPGIAAGQPCGARGSSSEPLDHGTHVVGLIAGSKNGKAGPGVNPNARIYFVRINPLEMKSDNGVYLTRVAERLNTIYKGERPEVVNMSFWYPFPQGLNDIFLSAIESNRNLTLFVAAAGNRNEELRSGGVCGLRPACGGVANLITVAALDLSGSNPVLDSSNYGTAVHIAAPGKSIVSTLSGGRIGAMSGTSQAAPLVSGAASLLLLKNPRLYPEAVKNRLIYTSDLFPSLYARLQGGRLNVARALAFESAQLSLRAGQSLTGDVVNIGSSIALVDVDTKAELNPLWSDIRRLKFEKELGYFTMFWKPGDGQLKRSFVTPQNKSQKLELRSAKTTPQLKTYTLSQIDDYVAAIPPTAQ